VTKVIPQNAPNLLIVDDDETIQRLLVMASRDFGWRPIVAGSGQQAVDLVNEQTEAVILDHGLPGMDGIETLKKLRQKFPALPIIMLTGHNDAETAVRALRAGAADYLTKPFEIKRLFELLRGTKSPEATLPVAMPARKRTLAVQPEIRSACPALQRLLGQLAKAARLESTILLTGESGTGKSFFAREIHRLSSRSGENFITVSCPALPRDLLESELFGHERGSFTGAVAARVGRFEQASKGTLFLDEIGDLPQELQPKLLNVLQDREFFRVGGSKILKTSARLIAATNVDLKHRVENGSFREDLYYRLNIIELYIPPLRERKQDLVDLTDQLLQKIALRRGVVCWDLSGAARALLAEFDWPGNVRQLENVLERVTAFAEKQHLDHGDFERLLIPQRETRDGAVATTLLEVERDAFEKMYLRNGKNKAKTARDLGISERSVYNLMARHRIK
jgi:DNA-binding NtrC family response regulator